MAKKKECMIEIDAQSFKDMIYVFRGQQVINQQVKNNAEKFEEDFMFQLSSEEVEILRSKKLTSSWGGRRTAPYVFTEQGIYMLMTVLKGELNPPLVLH